MEFKNYADSNAYFDINGDPFQSRKFCFLTLFRRLAILPVALCWKILRTGFRICGLAISVLLFACTLGIAGTVRELVVRRVSSVATDFADWLLYPFALVSCSVRLLVGGLIHPTLVFS